LKRPGISAVTLHGSLTSCFRHRADLYDKVWHVWKICQVVT
jgi:hypothetical protein